MKTTPLTRAVYLSAVFLVLAALAVPVSAADTTGCTKSYHLVLKLTPAGVTEQAVQLVYGYNPLPEAKSGDFKAVIGSADGRTLSEFYLHDPRIQFGDEVSVDKNGTATKIKGISSREKTAMLAVMFRQEANATSFSLYDNKGTLVKTVDLTKAEDRTNWNCTPDYGIVHKDQPQMPPLLLLGGAGVLIAGAIAGWFLLKKKNEKSGK
jgi:hypothetical protein